MKRHYREVIRVGALATGLMVSNLTAVQAQVGAIVTVNTSLSSGAIPPASFGSNVGCGDGEMVGPNVTAPQWGGTTAGSTPV